MSKRFLLFIFLSLCSLSCSKDTIGGGSISNASKPSTILYIYGGKKAEDYLGKLNASKYDSESIWNKYGKYGNKYNSQCIWNLYGTYGSKYGTYSPFSTSASYPPILVDQSGRFYGYFTANKYKTNRANYGIIDVICENHEKISKDVSGWYDKIF